MAFGRVNYFLRFLDSRLHEILSLRVLTAPPWGGTFREHGGSDVTICYTDDSSNYDVTIYGHDVTTYFNIYANYDDFPMTTCDNSTVGGTIGHDDVTVLYAI